VRTKRDGQQTKSIKRKKYKIYCGCTSKHNTPFILDEEEYELQQRIIIKCPDCGYFPWIRLGKRT
jgi:hypothetical protein